MTAPEGRSISTLGIAQGAIEQVALALDWSLRAVGEGRARYPIPLPAFARRQGSSWFPIPHCRPWFANLPSVPRGPTLPAFNRPLNAYVKCSYDRSKMAVLGQKCIILTRFTFGEFFVTH